MGYDRRKSAAGKTHETIAPQQTSRIRAHSHECHMPKGELPGNPRQQNPARG